MNVNKVVISVVTISLKIIITILIVFLVFQGGKRTYQFGRAIYLDEAVAPKEDAREITVTIAEGDSAMDIGNMLERKKLIKDAGIFYVQALLSEKGQQLKAGSYNLNTAMNAREIMEVIASGSDKSENNGE